MQEWKEYWEDLLKRKKLRKHIDSMEQVDAALGNQYSIEDVCHKIYSDYYGEWGDQLKKKKEDFLKLVEEFEGVHLQSSRIKKIDSLLEKVITKRYKYINNPQSKYYKIDGNNYKNIITDLIGMRLIINYRGNWTVIHNELIQEFPYMEQKMYDEYELIPHQKSANILAEIPIVYYAQGDKLECYCPYNVVTKLHQKGYRSIHYIVSFEGVYVEIQVRTIYDEAWSDCDHSYVYKQNGKKSHSALEEISKILCKLTNVSNDLGDSMREIFEKESILDIGNGNWKTTDEWLRLCDEALKRIENAHGELQQFRNHLVLAGGNAYETGSK